jgi:polar amino acid transport system substrate-binding protein
MLAEFSKIMIRLFSAMLLLPSISLAQPLDVLYFEYPPYYHPLPDGRAAGLIVDLARKVFDKAGVEAEFRFVPVKRILHDIQIGEPVASLGWFKTPEREEFARFSLPIYVNRPVGVFFLREKEELFRPYETLEALMASGKFSIGRVAGLSDGPQIDAMLAKHPDRIVNVTADSVRLVKMLESGRFDFFLLAPEEIDVLLQAAQVSPEGFALKAMSDIPHGNSRHIIYSKTVDNALINRVDDAILTEIGEITSEP